MNKNTSKMKATQKKNWKKPKLVCGTEIGYLMIQFDGGTPGEAGS
jgi:hypothetical protein